MPRGRRCHHNETVPREQWIYWDLGFLGWPATLLGGWYLLRRGREDTQRRAASH